MIIVIEKSGSSFRGAGLYYLHDKADDKDLPKNFALPPTIASNSRTHATAFRPMPSRRSTKCGTPLKRKPC